MKVALHELGWFCVKIIILGLTLNLSLCLAPAKCGSKFDISGYCFKILFLLSGKFIHMIPPSCFSSYNHFDCPNNSLTSKLTFPTKWNKTKKIEQICYYSSVTQVVHVLLLIFSPLTGPSPTLGSDGACAPAAWGGGDERVCLVFCILLALSSYFKHKRQVGFSLIDPYLSSEDQALSPVDSAHCNCMVPTCASFQLGWSPETVASRMIFQHYKFVTFDTGAVRCYKHQDNCAIKRRIDGKFN